MHKNLQQRYLATLRKCATPMPTFVAQTVTTQPQRQPQVVQKQQQEIQTRSYTVSSPKRCALPRNFGQCFDCFHVAAVSSVALNSSRSHGTSATKATATATTPQTTTRTPVTTITVKAAVDDMTASADMADFLITNTTKITSANEQTRGAEVKKKRRNYKYTNLRKSVTLILAFALCKSFPNFVTRPQLRIRSVHPF